MALSETPRRSLGHFFVRLLGLTGLAVALVGLVLWQAAAEESGWIVVAVGGGLVVLGLLGEIPGARDLFGTRRGAVGSNVFLQILLACLLLAGVNAFAFFHHQRFDWTRELVFSIPKEIENNLRLLRGETTIVVYQRAGSDAGTPKAKDRHYDAAAERKIIDKVRDLAEQFQNLGPRFHVELLDVKEKGYGQKLDALKKRSKALGEAIEQAPENSIFFYTRLASEQQAQAGEATARQEKIQRLAFHDIYQLDRQEALAANGGRGNLVLKYQGVEPFARKILNIEEKRPRIAVGVVHELLGLESKLEMYGMEGVKKTLTRHGLDSRDIMLKAWPGMRPAVLTYQEHEYERLEAQLAHAESTLTRVRDVIKFWSAEKTYWESTSLAEINKKYAVVPVVRGIFQREEPVEKVRTQGRGKPVSEEVRKAWLAEIINDDLPREEARRQQLEERRDSLQKKMAGLPVEDLAEKRRIADLRAKFNRMLADCDLLILPRMTIFDAVREEYIHPQYNRLYQLEEAQVDSLRDFLKAGKPILFLLGPSNEPERAAPAEKEDSLETLLADMGFKLPKQTILFDIETEVLTEQKAKLDLLGSAADVPPVDIHWERTSAAGRVQTLNGGSDLRHPIRTSLRLSTRGGAKEGIDLRLRNPRPVYYTGLPMAAEQVAATLGLLSSPVAGPPQALPLVVNRGVDKIEESTVFLMTHKDSWNEEQPFPTEDRVPKFERPKADDPSKGTVNEKRQGPFPIGVAVQTQLPATWFKEKRPAELPRVRVAVIGHGGPFTAATLNPDREKLLLDTCNWLLSRDDLLNKDNQTWQYPRVALTATETTLWQWGAFLGLPLLFVYLGMVVFLVRRMR